MSASGPGEWPAELLCFRGTDRVTAAADIHTVEQQLVPGRSRAQPLLLRDLARAQAGRGTGPVQVAVVADDLDDLRTKLALARAFTPDRSGVFVADGTDGLAGGRVAFLFPGQGSQRPGMLRDLFVAFPRLQRHLRSPYTDLMFPPEAHSRDEVAAQKAALTDTRVAQPTLGITGLAMHELLGTVGVRPDLAGGHSYGELVALCAAGAIAEDDLVALSETRAESILAAAGADPGTMTAVAGAAAEIRALLDPAAGVVVANDNAPGQTVVSGPTEATEAAVARLAGAGFTTKRLPVACAFHSPVVAGARVALGEALAACDVKSPGFPVWANTTARPYPAAPDEVRAVLAGQVAAPVRFTEQIEAMYEAGARVFVEAGPGRVLTQLVGRILGDRPHVAVACGGSGDDGLRRFLLALAELAVRGVPVDVTPLFASRDADA